MRGQQTISYQRVTLIDQLFVRRGQIRFCAVLLINGVPCRSTGHVFSGVGVPWHQAIKDWFSYLESIKRQDVVVKERVCVAGTLPGALLLDQDEEDAAFQIVLHRLITKQRPQIELIPYKEAPLWVEGLYDFVDELK
jgi:hypothetical protein